MKTKVLRVAIAPREAIVRYTRDIVAGRRRRATDDPDVWFTSVESFAKVLSEKNRALLALIAERRPDSIDALAVASGRAKSNLSRTLRTMERYGLVRLEKGDGRKLRPMVMFQRVELSLKVAA
jgi:predicted transcriptional regulator